jgi:hypothetical protein
MQMTKFDLRSKWPVLAEVILEHGPGWHGVLDKMLTSMEEAGFDEKRDKITQIKEKFGTIRVYVSFDQSLDGGIERMERIRKAMNEADKSARTCETCGKSGHLVVTEGWIMSRCEEHKPPNAKTLKEHFKR